MQFSEFAPIWTHDTYKCNGDWHLARFGEKTSVNIVATSLQLLLPSLFFQSTSLTHVSSVDSRFRPTHLVSLLSPQQRTSHHSCDHHTNATHHRGTPDNSLLAVSPALRPHSTFPTLGPHPFPLPAPTTTTTEHLRSLRKGVPGREARARGGMFAHAPLGGGAFLKRVCATRSSINDTISSESRVAWREVVLRATRVNSEARAAVSQPEHSTEFSEFPRGR